MMKRFSGKWKLSGCLASMAMAVVMTGTLRADAIVNWNPGVSTPGLPGTPSDLYTWDSNNSPFTGPLDDPSFPGGSGFVFTGNTYFSFNGGQQLELFSTPYSPWMQNGGSVMSEMVEGDSGVPEPGAFWMLGGGMAAMLAYGTFRVRRVNDA